MHDAVLRTASFPKYLLPSCVPYGMDVCEKRFAAAIAKPASAGGATGAASASASASGAPAPAVKPLAPAAAAQVQVPYPSPSEVAAAMAGIKERGATALNVEQRAAIAHLLAGAGAVVPYCLFGPPGARRCHRALLEAF